MGRQPVVRSKTKSDLGFALDHAIVCSHGVAAYAPYCLFAPGWLIGYDGVVASGYRIAEDLRVAPHVETMRNAIAKAGSPYAITSLIGGSLIVTGDKVRVEVPCNSLDAMPSVLPDAARYEVSEPFREAIINASKVTSARHARVFASGIFCTGHSVVGSDGSTILEAFHGMGFPGRRLFPTEFALALEKIKHKPTHIGFSDDTFTVWFGPHAWLRTNVYKDDYPDTDIMFARMISEGAQLRPIPPDMLAALMRLKPFLFDDTVTLWAGGFNTKSDGNGAQSSFSHHILCEIPRILPFAAMCYAATWGEWIGLSKTGMYWYGPVLRGATAASVNVL